MKRHLAYLRYVLRHKWFVLLAGWKLGCPLWRLLLHDMSKFRPSEWKAYAYTFYNEDGTKRYLETEAFNRAWLLHQHRNPHHWQYWMLRLDRGDTVCLEMPETYAYEMVADWLGAGRAISGKWEVQEWYDKNKDKIKLHQYTKDLVEHLIYSKGWN